MKKTHVPAVIAISAFLAAISAIGCMAQDTSSLMDRIESANSAAKIRKGGFTEERRRAAKAPQSLSGELAFDSAGSLSMIYSTPEGELFIIADGFITIKSNGIENKFDLTKNKPMKSLADLLISSFSGKLQSFASRNACNIGAEKTSTSVRVTVTATKKAVKGYSKVIADYDPVTSLLMSMVMEEFDGSVTEYRMK